jgi:SAM-dependent methyltransferase
MTHSSATPGFDRVARIYRWMEYATFGRSLERCREYYLPQMCECRSALVVGDGDGRFVARLLAANREVCADAVDSSGAMLRLLERRVEPVSRGAGERLRTHQADALRFSPSRSYDLIATHFFLDCLSQAEVNELCARVAAHVERQGVWVVSEFRIPRGAMYWPSRILVRLLYLAFRMLTGLRVRELPDHAAALAAAGFMRTARRLSLGGLLSSELWRLGEYTPAMLPPQHPRGEAVPDPLPDPEPASPSLPGPDTGVYHREPGTPEAEPLSDGASCE